VAGHGAHRGSVHQHVGHVVAARGRDREPLILALGHVHRPARADRAARAGARVDDEGRQVVVEIVPVATIGEPNAPLVAPVSESVNVSSGSAWVSPLRSR
jgi:hypothetical protein